MIDYFIADTEGRILMAGKCLEEELKYYTMNGCVTCKGAARVGEQYFDGKRVLDIPPSLGADYKFDYRLKKWVLDEVAAWGRVRKQRNQLLAECDWVLLEDAPVKNLEAWKEYRQKLRDITEVNSLGEVDWPTSP